MKDFLLAVTIVAGVCLTAIGILTVVFALFVTPPEVRRCEIHTEREYRTCVEAGIVNCQERRDVQIQRCLDQQKYGCE